MSRSSEAFLVDLNRRGGRRGDQAKGQGDYGNYGESVLYRDHCRVLVSVVTIKRFVHIAFAQCFLGANVSGYAHSVAQPEAVVSVSSICRAAGEPAVGLCSWSFLSMWQLLCRLVIMAVGQLTDLLGRQGVIENGDLVQQPSRNADSSWWLCRRLDRSGSRCPTPWEPAGSKPLARFGADLNTVTVSVQGEVGHEGACSHWPRVITLPPRSRTGIYLIILLLDNCDQAKVIITPRKN